MQSTAPNLITSALFDRIALSLSGGGFRAAAYGLGTLKGLYLLGLLDQVHMLSTASGGTITGAYYALRRKQGAAFPSIYTDFYQLLKQDTLLPHALTRWHTAIRSAPNYKLIRAFADTYSQDFYDGAQWGEFGQPDADAAAPFHLQSLIFGATELYSGLTFRFQYSAYLPEPTGSAQDRYRVGNGNVWVNRAYVPNLRLGDVVAASACFPGGFEPLVMPDDFFTEPTPAILGGGSKQARGRVALLDGGIYDNQGIESLLLANERNAKYANSRPQGSPQQAALLQPSTLFLVADVSGADTDLYTPSLPLPKPRSSPTLPQLGSGAAVLLIILLLVGIVLSQTPWRFAAGMITGVTLVGVLGLGAAWYAWRWLGKQAQSLGPAVPSWLFPSLAQLTLRQWRDLLAQRAHSTLALLTAVFMRRVRSLTYERLYNQPVPAPLAPGPMVVSSSIGRIVTDYERWKRRGPRPAPAPSVKDQLAVVYPTLCRAQQMPTTLWWQQEKHRLPTIVASAEITLYYLLLRRFEQTPPAADAREAEVQRRAQLLWDAYQRAGEGFLVSLEALAVLEAPGGTADQLLGR